VIAGVFRGEPRFFYHVHSYHPAGLAGSDVLATGTYQAVFPTIVGRDNVLGAQFHPEKSQRAGIELLDAFARWRP
jgi:glutamine amidotransferase